VKQIFTINSYDKENLIFIVVAARPALCKDKLKRHFGPLGGLVTAGAALHRKRAETARSGYLPDTGC
jgi:hypothetical protein